MKFSIKDFISKCDHIRRKLQIWSHLLKKSLMNNFIFAQCWIRIPILSFFQNQICCKTAFCFINSFMTEVPIIWKPVHWFWEQTSFYMREISVMREATFTSSEQVINFIIYSSISILHFVTSSKNGKVQILLVRNFRNFNFRSFNFQILQCKLRSEIICSSCAHESNTGFMCSPPSIYRCFQRKQRQINSLKFTYVSHKP